MIVRTAAIIIIGNEVLSGRTQDKNFAFIAERLESAGIDVREGATIPDDRQTIINTVHRLRPHTYIVTTGGIGPTHDDITAEAIAAAFNTPFALNPEAVKLLEAYYSAEQLNPARLRMAHIPVGASLIRNPVSQAPGFKLENLFCLAGVPTIMQAMMDDVMTHIEPGTPQQTVVIDSFLPEGLIASDLSAVQDQYPEVSIGSYPSVFQGKHHTRLLLRSRNRDALQACADSVNAFIGRLSS
jgi:molybdenum cofactor synthesis domain-containing protein